jgi:hypothetical protein
LNFFLYLGPTPDILGPWTGDGTPGTEDKMIVFDDGNMSLNHNRYANRWEVRMPGADPKVGYFLVYVWDDGKAMAADSIKEPYKAQAEEMSLSLVRSVKVLQTSSAFLA